MPEPGPFRGQAGVRRVLLATLTRPFTEEVTAFWWVVGMILGGFWFWLGNRLAWWW